MIAAILKAKETTHVATSNNHYPDAFSARRIWRWTWFGRGREASCHVVEHTFRPMRQPEPKYDLVRCGSRWAGCCFGSNGYWTEHTVQNGRTIPGRETERVWI